MKPSDAPLLKIHPTFFFRQLQSLQILVLDEPFKDQIYDGGFIKPLQKVLLNCSYLRRLEVDIYHCSELDSLFHFVFCDAREQGVWQDIMSVKFTVRFGQVKFGIWFFNQVLGRRQHYGKSWRKFTVTNDERDLWKNDIILKAST